MRWQGNGYEYFVSQGIGGPGGLYFTVRVQAGKASRHRVCSPLLPMRLQREDAQRDLDTWARGHKLRPIE